MCFTASVRANSPDHPAVYISKGCAPSSRCPSTDYQSYSVNAGVSHTYATVKCCDTDNCNYDSLPAPPPRPYSGQRCFFCVPGTSDCSLTLQCHEGEDRCFKATVTTSSGTFPLLGCTSSNVCDAGSKLGSLLYKNDSYLVSSGPHCCHGDSCNYHPKTVGPPILTPPSPIATTSNPLSGGRQCHSCADPNDYSCSHVVPVTCPYDTMCVNAVTQATVPGHPAVKIDKGCAPTSKCPATGYHTFSVSVGASRAITSIKCCDSDYCNYEVPAVHPTQPENGRHCYFCLPGSTECSLIGKCHGEEDKCFSATVTDSYGTVPLLGCTSSKVCDSPEALGVILYKDEAHRISSGMTCCHGNLCNNLTTPVFPTAIPKCASEPVCSPKQCPAKANATLRSLIKSLQTLLRQLQSLLKQLQSLVKKFQDLLKWLRTQLKAKEALEPLQNFLKQQQYYLKQVQLQIKELQQQLRQLQKHQARHCYC
ncbi:urokinase plasminogen activator surface receptor-like [Gouania willdenowi]|uniref:urokinase plasminogen activator surface receptor-like n=1 Tax=Gouania willdenowi TaxID=441366 RepID=UPI0010548193|nr:urokinase plasminogen activator surface receptor-like [Gouania willdenowi]